MLVLFSEDIRLGKVDRSQQTTMYDKKFAAAALTTQWLDVLALQKSPETVVNF